MKHNTFFYALIYVVLLTLSACGGGGGDAGGNSDPLTGQFLDSAVEGLTYETATQSGTTDSQGNFKYLAGETISFYIGNVLVGETTAQAIVTPLDLVAGATDETNAQVTNILRFLQSLDNNNDPSDNINIVAQARDLDFTVTIDFNQSIEAFAADTDLAEIIAAINEAAGSSLALISATAAQEHFRSTLLSLNEGGGDNPGGGIITPGQTGALSVTGADTSNFGNTFTPGHSWMQNPDRPAWKIDTNGRTTQLFVDINEDGSVRTVDFRVHDTDHDPFSNQNGPFFLYELRCAQIPSLTPPLTCDILAAHVSVDLQAKTVTFDALELPEFGFYDETAPITINGTLEYTGTLVFN